MKLKLILAAALVATIAACASAPSGQSLTPAQQVYQITSNYDAALQVAVAYANLPRCGQAASPTLCSKSEVIVQLQKANSAALPLLTAAQNTVTAPGAGANAQTALNAAQQAVAALTAISSTLQVK